MNKLSIIIPVYNEENTVLKVIESVKKISPVEIIIVDDGSTDGTRELLEKLTYRGRLQIIYHEKNEGKGSAVRTALKHITGDIVAIQDADLEYNPEDILELVKPINEKKADVVYGSRFLKRHMKNIYKRYLIGNWLMSKMISILYNYRITDSYTCYKVIKTEIMKNLDLKSKEFEIEAELTVKLLKNKHKILELPISYNPRTIEEGKKIGLKDAALGFLTIIRYYF